MVAWDHSCCLHCLTATITDDSLPDVTQGEMFMDEILKF